MVTVIAAFLCFGSYCVFVDWVLITSGVLCCLVVVIDSETQSNTLTGFLVWSLLLGCSIGFLVLGLAVALFGLFGLGFLWVLGCFLGFWLGYLGIHSCVLGGAMRFF